VQAVSLVIWIKPFQGRREKRGTSGFTVLMKKTTVKVERRAAGPSTGQWDSRSSGKRPIGSPPWKRGGERKREEKKGGDTCHSLPSKKILSNDPGYDRPKRRKERGEKSRQAERKKGGERRLI